MRPDTLAALLHVRHSARFIVEKTRNVTYEEFLSDELLRLGVERSFEIIGEAVNRIGRHDEATTARISEVRRIVGLRNVIIHDYDVIRYSPIWEAIHTSLPNLLGEVETLLEDADRKQPESPEG